MSVVFCSLLCQLRNGLHFKRSSSKSLCHTKSDINCINQEFTNYLISRMAKIVNIILTGGVGNEEITADGSLGGIFVEIWYIEQLYKEHSMHIPCISISDCSAIAFMVSVLAAEFCIPHSYLIRHIQTFAQLIPVINSAFTRFSQHLSSAMSAGYC